MQSIKSRIRNWFKKSDFKYNGHNFYVCDPYADSSSPNYLPTARALKFMNALNSLQIGLGREDLQSFSDELNQAIENNKLSQVTFLAKMLKARLELNTFESGFLDVANAIILVDNETVPNKKYDAIKKELCKNEEVKSFFLSIAIKSLRSTATLSNTSEVEDYLKLPEVKEIELAFQSSISNPS